MSIKAILFDLDDTLVVEQAAAERALHMAAESARIRYGIKPATLVVAVRRDARELWRQFESIDYCRLVGISSWEGLWARFLGPGPELERLRIWAPTYRRESWSRALRACGVDDAALAQELADAFPRMRRTIHEPFSDALPTLSDLRGDYRLGLVTNGVHDLQHQKIERARLQGAFQTIVISGEIGIGKPDRRIFEHALDALGVRANQAVMVGDSLTRDVQGARQAGLRAIWLNRCGDAGQGHDKADAVVAGLRELRAVLAGW